MKELLLLAALWGASCAMAQEDAEVASQRARIAAERSTAEAAFLKEEKACYGKFAVNDCLKAAREKHRAVVTDLRRQELSVNDSLRKRRGAERQLEIDERAGQDRQRNDPAERAKAVQAQREKEARGAGKSAEHGDRAATADARASQARDAQRRKEADMAEARARRERDAADSVVHRQKAEQDARERKAALDKRIAESRKPPASALPLPP